MTSNNSQSNRSNYKWYVLTLAALTCTFVVATPTMCMPVLFKEISEELGLTLGEIGVVWGMTPLAGVFVILIGGALGDRFGVKRVLGIGCFLAGLAGALRGTSNDLITLTATMFLFGLLTATLTPSIMKTCSIFFTKRNLGLAISIVAVGMALGFVIGAMISATTLSPLLGGWRNVLLLYGAISIFISVLWFLIKIESSQVESSAKYTSTMQLRHSLSQVVRIKRLWFLAAILFGYTGCVQGTLGYLPLYLRNIGWTEYSADGSLALFHGVSTIGAIPIALLSGKLSSRKPAVVVTTLMSAIGVGLLSVANGPMVWASVIIAGIVRDGFVSILLTMAIETEGVGPAYSGTASGFVQTFARLGGFVAPLIGNNLAYIRLSLPFIFWSALAALALAVSLFLKGAQRRPDTGISITSEGKELSQE